MLAWIKPNLGKNQIKRLGAVLRVLRHYCTNATVHGLRYVVDPHLHGIERFLWFFIFATHAILAATAMLYLTQRVQEAPTSIGIESMHHRISSVPFPSVTLCPNDRVDWTKLLELEKLIFPNNTDRRTLKTFRDVMLQLSVISFGDFQLFDFLKRRRLDGLTDVNVTDVLLRVGPSCSQLFVRCWWRNSFRDCCEIFELQKTEYGFCYSFNSQLAETVNQRKYHGYREHRPRRATSYGAWSGLRVTARMANVTKPPDSHESDGILFMLDDPRVWPNNGRVIPANSLTTVSFDCISGFATQSILELDESRAPCRHKPEMLYAQETCISFCKQKHTIEHCGCNPSFMFPAGSTRECNVSDFICLADHNDLYRDNILTEEEEAFEKDPVICNCPPGCDYNIYTPHLSAVRLYQSADITVDVHFSSQTNFRYKMDLVYTRINFLVSFGGIIGLFLGGSLLSAIELVYYLAVMVFRYLASCRPEAHPRAGRKIVNSGGPPTTLLALPIQDYGPVKPRPKRIPILVNYAAAKSNLNRY
ncbi:pickpocket protein 19 [Megalopta genalis]|uniref:pickpocket protein 19 n=1 Tax=Megalopta genalis TaxID=115081 RepID=UPI003FCF6CEE